MDKISKILNKIFKDYNNQQMYDIHTVKTKQNIKHGV